MRTTAHLPSTLTLAVIACLAAAPSTATPSASKALAVRVAAASGAGPSWQAAVEGPPPSARATTGVDVCASTRPHLLCPDLVMSTPSEVHVDRTTRPGHVLLRATSSINNHGTGPLELRARRIPRHGWRVYQALRDARAHVHLSRIAATLVYKFVPGSRYGGGEVGAANYWKLRHAASMQLWSIDAQFRPVGLVRAGVKVDYCLRDLRRTAPSRRSPAVAIYPACNENPRLRRDVLGTSAGWSDIYPYDYPDQWIDVTGLEGRFALVFIANPDHALLESAQGNNLSETYVMLPGGRVLGRRGPVSQP